MSTARLTRRAAEKYADMCDTADEVNNRIHVTLRRIGETERQILDTKGDPIELRHELARMKHKMSLDQTSHAELARTATAVRAWLAQIGPSFELRDAPPSKCRPGEGESYLQAVKRVRAEIEELSSKRRAAARSVLPADELYKQVDAYVAGLANQCRPMLATSAQDQLPVVRFEGEPKALALAAWLQPNALMGRLRVEVDQRRATEQKMGVLVLTRAERDERLADIAARMLLLERDEEQLIVDALDNESTVLQRRPDASPAALLGVVVEKKQPPAPIEAKPAAAPPTKAAPAPRAAESVR